MLNSSGREHLSNFTDGSPEKTTRSIYYIAPLTAMVFLAILSPVAVAANSLLFAVIWRNPLLRTPSYILLSGLALTDFITGLILQPVYVSYKINELRTYNTSRSAFCADSSLIEGFGTYVFTLTIWTRTLLSVERWLHLTKPSFLTVWRTKVSYGVILAVPIPLSVVRSLRNNSNGCRPGNVDIATLCSGIFCLTATSVAMFKLVRIIRHHQRQIHSSTFSNNRGQAGIDLAKYRKSVITIACILALFYVCNFPLACCWLVLLYSNGSGSDALYVVSDVSFTFYVMSSSLNPIFCCWRMNDIRDGIRQLAVKLLCKSNNLE